MPRTTTALLVLVLVAGAAASIPEADGPAEPARASGDRWTPERVAAALPRDLVVDAHGRGYVRAAGGGFVPHGHDGPPAATPLRAVPTDRPDGGASSANGGGRPTFDTDPPAVADRDPTPEATIGDTWTFGATVTDASDVKGVQVHVAYPADSPVQTFHATREGPRHRPLERRARGARGCGAASGRGEGGGAPGTGRDGPGPPRSAQTAVSR